MATRTPIYPRQGATGAYQATPGVADRRRDMKYKVNTTSTTASGVVPIKGATRYPAEPTIYFTREAWVKQCHIVKTCNKEVGWFAMVDYCDTDNSFTITELVIPNQEVTGTETDIGKEDLADAATELIEQGKDTSKLYAWFHSHVNMGVGPSPQDEFQIEDYLEDLADQPEVPAFIRGIQNKSGNLKLDVYYIQHGVAYQNLDFFVIHDDDPQWLTDIEAEIKAKVIERTYNYWGGSRGNHQATGKSQGNAGAKNAGAKNDNNYYYNRGYGGVWDAYDDWDSIYHGLDYDDDPAGGAAVDTADDPHAPKPVKLSNKKLQAMEVVYNSPKNMEVMLDDENKLWVCDDAGDMYEYEEYTAVYGEIDGDVHNSQPYIFG